MILNDYHVRNKAHMSQVKQIVPATDVWAVYELPEGVDNASQITQGTVNVDEFKIAVQTYLLGDTVIAMQGLANNEFYATVNAHKPQLSTLKPVGMGLFDDYKRKGLLKMPISGEVSYNNVPIMVFT